MGGKAYPLGDQETQMQVPSLLYPRASHMTPLSTVAWLSKLWPGWGGLEAEEGSLGVVGSSY